tara:strand:+ start:2625 stop:3329 length:705 start_codon:yes stop_codon:yes gene_type:complete
MKHALVVLSGGQDSVTCLGLALKKADKVSAISFNYGQRHAVELDSAALLCAKYGVEHKVVAFDFLKDLVTSALTTEGADVNKPHPHKKNLPASFVPCRNAIFLTLAHGYAQEIDADTLVTGVCETDYSGYPDCREIFIGSLETTLNIGYEANIRIWTPLMKVDKAQTFFLAQVAGFLDEVLENSHTCYEGDHTTRNTWGFGCGECPACILRRTGYELFFSGEYNRDHALILAEV